VIEAAASAAEAVIAVDLWLEKRHLQAVLLDFLQRRFPERR
jgi:hypothetical protein